MGKLNLVKLGNEYFPYSEEDFLVLQRRGCFLTRMSETAFGVVRETIVPDIEIEILDPVDAYNIEIDSLQSGFDANFTAEGDPKLYRGDEHGNRWFGVSFDPKNRVHASFVENLHRQCGSLFSRWGLAITRLEKDANGERLVKFQVSPSPTVVPGYLMGAQVESHILQLSKVVRLRLTHAASKLDREGKKKSLTLSLEDLSGPSEWTPATTRTHEVSGMSPDQLTDLALLFLDLAREAESYQTTR